MPYLYSAELLVEPPALFGRKLRPLSLGHARILHALGHPALTDGKLMPADIGTAVWVCSQAWESAAEKIRTGRHLRQIRRMGRRSRKKSDAVSAFEEYRMFYIDAPPRRSEGRAEQERVPWFMELFCAVQKSTALTPAETWALTPRAAAEICAGIGVLNGDKTLLTTLEQKLEEQA